MSYLADVCMFLAVLFGGLSRTIREACGIISAIALGDKVQNPWQIHTQNKKYKTW